MPSVCVAGSPGQVADDLAAHAVHRHLLAPPRWSSGSHGDDATMAPFWDALHQDGVELALNGHEHVYERFAPQLPGRDADPNGIRQLTVGTGGKNLTGFGAAKQNSAVRLSAFGVKLTGRRQLRGVREGPAVLDSGTGTCHRHLNHSAASGSGPGARRNVGCALSVPRYEAITRSCSGPRRGALGDHLARFEAVDAVADRHHHRHVVLDDQDRGAELALDRLDQRAERLRLLLGDARGGLVEQDEARVEREERAELHDAPRPGRQLHEQGVG
jgi:hypothetical protein